MVTLRATLELRTAFGTPLAGDTLFGQLCWAAREHLGEAELGKLLKGYTAGNPWLVVSDGFPAGYLPKPTVPASLVGANSFAQSGENRANEFAPTKPASTRQASTNPATMNHAQQRKAEKAKHWIPLSAIGLSLPQMLAAAVKDEEAFGEKCANKFAPTKTAATVGANSFAHSPIEAPQPHNTLNRLTGTTGEGEFAPYTQPQIFFARGQRMDVYCVLDETRMSQDTLLTLLQAVGSYGFGRDASIGLGKFSVETPLVGANSFAQHPQPNAYLTLAPCAPQGRGFDGDKSYWRVLTRFGRHGNLHGISEKPFKNPVLLAAIGAVFVPQAEYATRQFIGQGLGGSGQLSKVEPATVQQGYAPVVGIRMEE